MNLLKQKIIERIESEGPVSFETFMEMCLYYPGLGYYMKDTAKIGRTGDFYTSPHVHPIFGSMIARQLEEMWLDMAMPTTFHIVETGAGMGHLSRDILQYVNGPESEARSPAFGRCLKYTIVELNQATQTKQQEVLAEFTDKIQWVSNLDDLEPITGCFISNELLDAFPVRVVEKADGLFEIYVSATVSTSDDKQFTEVRRPWSAETKGYFDSLGVKLPEGYRTEANIRMRDWIKQVSGKLSEGFVLTVDYGYSARDYYAEDRNRGTLLCYYRHQINENPYQNIGEQDLTSHVNFSSLRNWGEECGLKTLGFCPQGTYLVSLGIDEVIAEIYGSSPDPFETAGIKNLILPQGMGESHKVMIQYKGRGSPVLRGFSLRNQQASL